MDANIVTLLIVLIPVLWFAFRWFRRQFLIPRLLTQLKKHLPAISSTEREAIEAGNTWWEKELFCGKPDWKNLFSLPQPVLTQEEENFLKQQTEHLCTLLDDWQIVAKDHDLPENVWEYLKQEKFFGMVIPKEYGGHGFSALAHSTIITKIATRSISAAVNTMVPNSLGPAELLLHYGTEEQKNHYLPRLAAGKEIPCFALTAPEAGSDASAIPDKGIVCRDRHDGKETLGIRLSWDKRYITLAPIATVLGLAFHLYDPDHLLGQEEDIGITLCLIPTTHAGVEIGTRHFPLYLAFMNGPTRGNNVFIPLDWIIGGPKMAGQGWRMLMECLSIGRSISLPALSTACGKLTYRNTGAYARIRQQFNTPLAAFEGIEEALSKIAGYTYQLEACRIMTAGAVDLKIRPSIASAIAKYHMTELSRKIVDNAMDIHAGHMIQVGPRNFLANIHFSIPISITVEGANILTRSLIIFGQGAIRCHPYLLKEIACISSSQTDVREFDKLIMSHIGFFFSNIFRSLYYGLTGGHFISASMQNKRVRAYQKQLTRMSSALALLADASLMLLGGSLKRRERLSARLGDIMSQLYLGSSVFKYFHDHKQPESDIEYVCWTLQDCLYKLQQACDELLDNFPYRWTGKLLKWLVFPFGRAYHAPLDKQSKAIVKDMLFPSVVRERLTKYCFISHDNEELSQQLENGLSKAVSIDPILKKMQKSLKRLKQAAPGQNYEERLMLAEKEGILTTDESKQLREYEALRAEIIRVNEFSFDLEKVIA